ncbi:hypothetical protein Bca52824_001885 [Brassica carinata]|uniref:Uncharacterized protein n=1 Tax=Brassica carinata TaxID=52824 RepID=A0A8X7WL13_BRACI|nr:hypothetical protein Bca52824_001885 [Brassica carinata]
MRFGTKPSPAKFLVAEGMAKRTPSSFSLAMTWHPSRYRSQGGLVEIDIWYFGTDSLLSYIADITSENGLVILEKPSGLIRSGFRISLAIQTTLNGKNTRSAVDLMGLVG